MPVGMPIVGRCGGLRSPSSASARGLRWYSVGNYRKHILATPNYGYEKRQKELAKKQKKADKLKEKNERKTHGPEDEAGSSDQPESEAASESSSDAAS